MHSRSRTHKQPTKQPNDSSNTRPDRQEPQSERTSTVVSSIFVFILKQQEKRWNGNAFDTSGKFIVTSGATDDCSKGWTGRNQSRMKGIALKQSLYGWWWILRWWIEYGLIQNVLMTIFRSLQKSFFRKKNSKENVSWTHLFGTFFRVFSFFKSFFGFFGFFLGVVSWAYCSRKSQSTFFQLAKTELKTFSEVSVDFSDQTIFWTQNNFMCVKNVTKSIFSVHGLHLTKQNHSIRNFLPKTRHFTETPSFYFKTKFRSNNPPIFVKLHRDSMHSLKYEWNICIKDTLGSPLFGSFQNHPPLPLHLCGACAPRRHEFHDNHRNQVKICANKKKYGYNCVDSVISIHIASCHMATAWRQHSNAVVFAKIGVRAIDERSNHKMSMYRQKHAIKYPSSVMNRHVLIEKPRRNCIVSKEWRKNENEWKKEEKRNEKK